MFWECADSVLGTCGDDDKPHARVEAWGTCRLSSGVQSREFGEGEGASSAHFGAHEIHHCVEALTGAGSRGDGALTLVGRADRQDRLEARELARASQVLGDGGQFLLQSCDAVTGALGGAVARG